MCNSHTKAPPDICTQLLRKGSTYLFATSNAPITLSLVVMAEWLRRWTRNPLGSARVGSNPTDHVFSFSFFPSASSVAWAMGIVYACNF